MIGAIVLAAGSSDRMGRSKAALPIGEGSTFEAAIRVTLAGAGVHVLRVVVAPDRSGDTDDVVVNPDPTAGMLSSVQCGLRALPPNVDAVLIWPVDHPLVKTATIDAIIAAHRSGNAPVVVPTYGGKRGHPGLFSARVFPEMLAADPSRGAREVVHAHADRLELAVDDPGVIEDIDTPEDYARVFGASS